MKRRHVPLIGVLSLVLGSAVFAGQPAPQPPAPTKTFTYKKINDVELKMVVHFPDGWKASDKRPGIVFFFGGGWRGGSLKQFDEQADNLAARGMVAACADYRVKSRQDVTPKECVQDAKSAIRWFRQHAFTLGVDPDRIVAAGGSAGGHIAACTALTSGLDAEGEDTNISSRPDALVLFNPVLKFTGDPKLMHLIHDDEALGKAISPALHVTAQTPPTLMLYGSEDHFKIAGDEYLAKAKELGVKAEMFVAQGQEHGFFNRPPWKDKTIQRMDEFLAQIGYIKPAKAADSGK